MVVVVTQPHQAPRCCYAGDVDFAVDHYSSCCFVVAVGFCCLAGGRIGIRGFYLLPKIVILKKDTKLGL